MRTLSEQAQYFAEIQEFLVKGALDLFAGYGLPVEHSGGGAAVTIAGPSVMAVIGYAATTVRGSLLLLTSRAVVATLQPPEARTTAPPTDASLCDVLGEFCNMLTGRMKNRLVTRGVVPLLSTPTTIFGDYLQLPVPTSGMSAWHQFSSATGAIYVRLDATLEVDFVLASEDVGTAAALEGEMILF